MRVVVVLVALSIFPQHARAVMDYGNSRFYACAYAGNTQYTMNVEASGPACYDVSAAVVSRHQIILGASYETSQISCSPGLAFTNDSTTTVAVYTRATLRGSATSYDFPWACSRVEAAALDFSDRAIKWWLFVASLVVLFSVGFGIGSRR